jgi:hypothetical protein
VWISRVREHRDRRDVNAEIADVNAGIADVNAGIADVNAGIAGDTGIGRP